MGLNLYFNQNILWKDVYDLLSSVIRHSYWTLLTIPVEMYDIL